MKGYTRFSIASLLGMSLCSLSCGPSSTASNDDAGGGADTGSGSMLPNCPPLTGYVASSTTMYSFATDIAPILTNIGTCGLGTACHGNPGVFLDSAMTKQLSFAGAPATVKATLLASSVNAPSMKRVVPGNVGASFLAYKVSGMTALTCIASNCKAGTTTGTKTACGDPMPALMLGMLAPADQTKILDWIAQGAKD